MSKEILKKNGYSIDKEIKRNKVFYVTRKNKKYVAKIPKTKEMFNNEVYYTKLFQEHNICPRLIETLQDTIIITERMKTVYDDNFKSQFPKEKFNDKFVSSLDSKIKKMHNLGYGHGDLYFGNIVVDGNFEPYIIDFEHVYQILNHSWDTEEWMRLGFNWESTYKDFVNNDYESYRYSLNKPIVYVPDITPQEEEYYEVRFSLKRYYIHEGYKQFTSNLQEKLPIRSKLYGVYNLDSTNYIYCVLKLSNGKYIDSTGIYSNQKSLLKMCWFMFNKDSKDGDYLDLNIRPIDNTNEDTIDSLSEDIDSIIKSLEPYLENYYEMYIPLDTTNDYMKVYRSTSSIMQSLLTRFVDEATYVRKFPNVNYSMLLRLLDISELIKFNVYNSCYILFEFEANDVCTTALQLEFGRSKENFTRLIPNKRALPLMKLCLKYNPKLFAYLLGYCTYIPKDIKWLINVLEGSTTTMFNILNEISWDVHYTYIHLFMKSWVESKEHNQKQIEILMIQCLHKKYYNLAFAFWKYSSLTDNAIGSYEEELFKNDPDLVMFRNIVMRNNVKLDIDFPNNAYPSYNGLTPIHTNVFNELDNEPLQLMTASHKNTNWFDEFLDALGTLTGDYTYSKVVSVLCIVRILSDENYQKLMSLLSEKASASSGTPKMKHKEGTNAKILYDYIIKQDYD